MFYSTHYLSPVGPLELICDGQALTELRPKPAPVQWEQEDSLPIFTSVRNWLDAYFSGNPRPVDFPLAPAGTDFQKRVWSLLLTVPYGETATYGQLARQLGKTMSPQAVGQAVGRNPIGIIIPCHRIVGAKGQLTGYAWGIEIKKWLLAHEEEQQ